MTACSPKKVSKTDRQRPCTHSGHVDSPSDSIRSDRGGNSLRKPHPCSVPHFVLNGEVSHWAVVICARSPGNGDVPGVDLQTSHCWLSWLFWPSWRNMDEGICVNMTQPFLWIDKTY